MKAMTSDEMQQVEGGNQLASALICAGGIVLGVSTGIIGLSILFCAASAY